MKNGNYVIETIDMYADVADRVIIDDENIKLYKGKDEIISFMRYVKCSVNKENIQCLEKQEQS